MKTSRNKTYKLVISTLGLFALLFFPKTIWSQITYEEAFPNLTFNFPLEIVNAEDGLDRIFILEQPGKIKVFPNKENVNQEEVTTFLDLTNEVAFSSGQEIGLLGLAFHPKFKENKKLFVYYTVFDGTGRINMVLDEFVTTTENSNVVDYNSKKTIFKFKKNQNNSNHNGGKIAFGPDSYLYVSIGDGGGGGDPQRNGQNLNTVFGSILRIDVDLDNSNPIENNPESPNGNYEIPSDNPLVGVNGLNEIFAWGIRNTWKFSFDSLSNKIWGADVGQTDYEEINIIKNGGNYGWNRYEGLTDEQANTILASIPDIKPFYSYDHDNGDVSITGGYVYRGSSIDTLLSGKYVYGDYVSGRVWSISTSANSNAEPELLFRTNGQFISSFGVDEAGELYFSDYNQNAKIYKIRSKNDETPVIPEVPITFIDGNWDQISSGVNGIVESIAVDNIGNYYVGGEFTSAGGKTANNLAMYSLKLGWRAIGRGTNGRISTVEVDDKGQVYIGGSFSLVDGNPIDNIAKWDGQNWSALASGTDGTVLSISLKAEKVYVGGTFINAGNVTANNIALYENDEWKSLTDMNTGISGTNNEIRSVINDENGNIYIGGNFDSAGGKGASRIAQWNGSLWSSVGIGTSGFVQAMAITDEFLYAGGNFSIAGGIQVNRIARWNRNSGVWQALDDGLSGNVNTIILEGKNIYVGGSFETASGGIMNNLASWNETEGWKALGTEDSFGVDVFVKDLEFKTDGSGLIVGGRFDKAGEIDATNVAFFYSNSPLYTFCDELPSEWQNRDIGAVQVSGSVCYKESNEIFEIKASGEDIWSNQDEFHYAYQELTGDMEITARLVSLEDTNAWAKAGVMIRNDLGVDSKQVIMLMTPDGGSKGPSYSFQQRNEKGQSMTTDRNTTLPVATESFNYFLKLVRKGDTFSGYTSATNEDWKFVESITIPMENSVLVGLAVTSHTQGILTTAIFDNVNVTTEVVLEDTTAPVINLIGAPLISLNLGDTYSEEGATATDAEDGDLTEFISITGDIIDTEIAGEYIVKYDVSDAAGNLAVQVTRTVYVIAIDTNSCDLLTSPWQNKDIGAVQIPGSACFNAYTGIFEIKASGADIWGNRDEFHYVYQELTGDMEITACVVSLEQTNQWAKAGVMIRNEMGTSSKQVMMLMTPDGDGQGSSYSFQHRNETGQSMTTERNVTPPVATGSFPYYLKLVRTGNTFLGYASPSNGDWQLVSSTIIPMEDKVIVGLAVTSHNVGVLTKAVFGNVSFGTDTIPPVISLIGESLVSYEVGDTYIEQGATATDNEDGDLTDLISISGDQLNMNIPGDYIVHYDVNDAAGNSAIQVTRIVRISYADNCSSLQPPWQNSDIGAVQVQGDACYNPATEIFEIEGSGGDIWNNRDEFQYVYQELSGDVEIVARVISMEKTSQWAKAGVMIRETNKTDSKQAIMLMTPDGDGLGVSHSFQHRNETGQLMTTSNNATPPVPTGDFPYYIRMVRSGDIFTGYASSTNGDWELVSSATITMNTQVLVGMAVSSHNPEVLNKAIFSEVLIISNSALIRQVNTNEPLLYPNPSNTEAIIFFEEPVNIFNFTLYDMLSRVVRSYMSDEVKVGDEYILNVQGISAGTYFIRMQDDKGNELQKKLVIQ